MRKLQILVLESCALNFILNFWEIKYGVKNVIVLSQLIIVFHTSVAHLTGLDLNRRSS